MWMLDDHVNHYRAINQLEQAKLPLAHIVCLHWEEIACMHQVLAQYIFDTLRLPRFLGSLLWGQWVRHSSHSLDVPMPLWISILHQDDYTQCPETTKEDDWGDEGDEKMCTMVDFMESLGLQDD